MDLPEDSNVTDKSWDHPWTTDEMRQHRDDWSLAADAGLLKHLRQFSDNLTERVQKTQEKLNSLSGELEEASVIIDNVTNASLALANTQFIESRVYEDEVEIDITRDTQDSKANEEELYKDDLIACVSESIKQGLNIMDEKFQRLEVLASDSEDEGEVPIPSVVLKPIDPYENRPLPYVIGTEKWKSSSKVGLESSSSDSEPQDGDEDSASENKNEMRNSTENNRRASLLLGSSSSSSSSSSDLSGRNARTSAAKDYSSISSRTEKLEARSQDTLNSGSEIATPSVVQPKPGNSSKGAPSFAEELSKRLGNVLPGKTFANPVKDSQEADQSSINRFKDDLFASDGNDVFDTKSENLFDDDNNLFDDDVSNSLWKDKPYRPPITNIIPPSLDVPPPMHAEATKPKSAFDDLCGDPESEDSDNIFAPKSSFKSIPPYSTSASDDNKRDSSHTRENKFLKIVHGDNTANMATSTPEMNDNGGLFGDENDYEGDDVLFGESVKSRNRTTERSPELAQATSRTTPQGPLITQSDILSSNLGSRLFQRIPRQDSSDSSDNESSAQHSNPSVNPNNERIVAESDSSGISTRPNSNTISSTTFGLGASFEPEFVSTRLKSEEIYRERYPSDSLFEARTRQPEHTNSIENSSPRRQVASIISETVDSARDEDFDADDVFGPPPLPKHNDSKTKNEFTSNDDLFSNSSSESRSHKSFDLLAAGESQYDVKITSDRSSGGGLFDEDVDIFGNEDAPQIDIFGEAFKTSNISSRESVDRANSKISVDSIKSSETKKRTGDSLNEKIIENPKSSLSTGESSKSIRKSTSIFDDSEDENDEVNDLFGKNFLKNNRKIDKIIMSESEDDEIFSIKPSTTGITSLKETKKDSTSSLARANVIANETTTKQQVTKLDSDEPSIVRTLPNLSSSSSVLFDNLEEKYVDDSLFASDDVCEETKMSDEGKKILSDDSVTCDKTSNESTEFRKNCALNEESSKKENRDDSGEKKSGQTEDLAGKNVLETSSLKKDDTRGKLFEDDDVSSTDGGIISKTRNSQDIIGEITRRDPPKTLSIRLPMPSDDTSQLPRRAVSGKIKNLMGKMGDLKILSPTDTPPLWRKNEEKTDIECERQESKDSEDGSFMSVPSTKSPTIVSRKNEDNDIFPETTKEPLVSSPIDDLGNSETAVSFDVPAQIEVLAVTASKSRARIQAKRRPQSRHARQSALRKSGIDFDTVDNSAIENIESDPSDNTFSAISDNILTVVTDTIVIESTVTNRLVARDIEAGKSSMEKNLETISSLAPEDRSEMSFSKGSSLSLNKNTLLSPSTDEEDLFDVPPDLPEDPPKEDTLFGRAPILSPIDRSLVDKNTQRSKERHRVKDSTKFHEAKEISKVHGNDEKIVKEEIESAKSLENSSKMEKPTDPLRDNNHDPLKDPSQLFAFVTKTPSPEKGQNVTFKEDASLFTHLAKKTAEEAISAMKKPILDLFADDTGGDLFTENIAKTTKKSIKSTRNNTLFDDVENIEEDSTTDLFGGRTKISDEKNVKMDESIVKKSRETSGRASSPSRGTIFAENDDDDDLLFVNASDKKLSNEREKHVDDRETKLFPSTSKITKDTTGTSTRISDIFGDQSSGEEDLFGKSKIIRSGRNIGASGSLFAADDPDDEDTDDIFGKKVSSKSTRAGTIENRSIAKKALTRDLKKTAETIVQDPLSMLQDD